MRSSFLKHLCSKAWMLLSKSAVSVQLSHPYIKIDRTKVLYSLNLIGKLIALLFHMVASLVIADMAKLILALTSVAACTAIFA